MKICLTACYLINDEMVQFMNQLGRHLISYGYELVLLSYDKPQSLEVPIIELPFLFHDYPKRFQGHSSFDNCSDLTDSDKRIISTDILFGSGLSIPYEQHLRGYHICSYLLGKILDILKPSIGFIWGHSHPQSILLTELFKSMNIPSFMMERGFFPGTLMVEPNENSPQCQLNEGEWLRDKWVNLDDMVMYESIKGYYLNNKPMKYAQNDYVSADVLRENLGLANKQIVAFWGQHDVWSGLLPRETYLSNHLSPFFNSTEHALQRVSEAIKEIPNTCLVFKPHPYDSKKYTDYQDSHTIILEGINNHTVFEIADVFMAMLTTTQFESLFYEKPLILLANSQLKGKKIAYEYCNDDLKDIVRSALIKTDFQEKISNAKKFITGLFQDYLIGDYPEIPTWRKANDLARFIMENGKNTAPEGVVDTSIQNVQKFMKSQKQNKNTVHITFQNSSHDELRNDAEIIMNNGHFDVSETLFQKALENDSSSLRTLHQYAIFQYSKGKTDEAIEILEKSLGFDPDNAEIMNDLGTMYYSTGEKDRAITLFNKAIDTDPNMFAARMNLADLYTESEQFERAEPIYQKILCINPDNTEALACLAGLYKTLGRIEEALSHLERAALIKPDHLDILKNLADIYLQADRSEDAVAIYEKVLSIIPEDVESLLVMGALMHQLNRSGKAAYFFRKVLDVDSDNVQAKEHLLLLEGQKDHAQHIAADGKVLKVGLLLATRDDPEYNAFVATGLGYVAANLRKSLPQVTVFFKERVEDMLREEPDLIGISSVTENYYIAIQMAEAIKKHRNLPVVLGGIHISLIPESLKPCFDIGVIGEGEITFVEVVKTLLQEHELKPEVLKDIPGIVFWEQGQLVKTPPREILKDLDSLPEPVLEELPYYRPSTVACLVSARGCPYHCTFCASEKFARTYRSFSTKRVLDTIEDLVWNKNISHIVFYDDLLIANKKKISELVDGLEQRRLLGKCSFSCQVRANVVDDEICSLLRKMNVVDTGMGVESFSDKILRYYNKSGVTAEVNQRALDILHRHGIKANPSIIFAAPPETREDMLITFRKVYENIREGKINTVAWGILRPYPGTKIWDYAEARGIVGKDMDWNRFSDWSTFDNYLCEEVQPKEFYEMMDEWSVKNSLVRKPGSGYSNFWVNDTVQLYCKIDDLKESIRTRTEPELGDDLVLARETCIDNPLFGEGWFEPEKDKSRWMKQSARLIFKNNQHKRFAFLFYVQPEVFKRVYEDSLEIKVFDGNERLIFQKQYTADNFGTGLHSIKFPIPRNQDVCLDIRFDKSMIPAEHGLGRDDRRVSVLAKRVFSIGKASCPNNSVSRVAQESLRMKQDWNARAEENSRYYIHSTNMDQSEEDFDASGKHNVQTIIVNDLATIAGGADPKTMVALEIGCGIGRMTKHLARVFKEIHGVDVSGEMIRQAKSRLEYLPNAYCYETSGTDLSIFADGMFDFVFSFIVFQHIPSKEVILDYLREAHRVLKTGGVFKFQVQGCTDPQWMRAEKDTWHGVTITEEDVDGISLELGFDLVAKSGQGTQYSWYTLKKSGVVAKSKKPLLASIVIPVYNQLEYTRQCLDALGKNTPEDLYELIVVDNNSTDGTHEYLSKITGNVKIITNRENMGFTIACNQGAKAAQGRYLVFLNNDTIPLDGWLTSLLDTFKIGDGIGAVGSKLIYPDTRLQEAGGIIFSDGNGWNFGRGDSPDFGRYNKLIEVDYCSGASLAVRKDLFDELGGFDEIYAPAYYEDTDLCFSLREKGYRILYQPESEIIHCEGKTAGSDTGSGFKKYQVINHEKFNKKWEHRLQDQGPSPYKGAPKPFTADRKRRLAGYTHNNKINKFVNSVTADSAETINFLIIDPFLPIYDKASGSFRLFQIVKILANTPHVHITYLARHGHHGDKYIKLLTSMGVEVHHTDPEKLFSFDIFVQKLSLNMKYILAQKKYHYAYLSFYEIALQYLPEIRLYSPDTKIVIDTVDIHFLREMRQAELYDDNDLMKKAHTTKENELDIYQRADALITVTDQDADVIRPYFPQKPIYIIPNIHPVERGKLSFQDRSGIIFIGNYYHPPNVDAVEYLLRDIQPKLRKKGLSIPIQIIGDGLPDNVKKFGDKNVLFTGWVPETKPYLENAKISIAPLRYGAGMKGKVGEALAAGLPVITTSIGAEGMGLCHEKDALIADTADEFADAIIQLYKNESLWTTLQENGIEFIEKNYSIAAVQKNVQEIFNLSEAQLHTEDTLSVEKSKITSIIIPCFNQLEYTKKCLESIFKHTRDNYELILVDNGSTDGTRNYISKLAKDHEHVQIILNDKNLGFAAANNQGLGKAKGDYILFLNNDVVVTEGWLERLISHLEQFPDIGMVGPMSNSVSGDQLVKNVPYKNKLNAMHKFAREFAKNNYGKVTEIMRLVGFCLLIKKEVLEVIGGLDENYGSGNFEDDDLCLRSYIAGYKNIIAGDVFIHHYGSMTFKGNSLDYMATMKKNLSYFGEKWKDIIEVHDTGYKIHLTKEQQIQKLICWGEEKYSSGDLRSAIKIFERVLWLDKRNSQALSNLGVIQWQLGKAISAIDTFQKAIFLDPKDHDALANLVQAVSELNRYDLIQNNLIDLLRQSQPANPDFKRLMEIQEPALNA